MKQRTPLWDNLRFLLITLVVVVHFSDFFTDQSQGYKSLFLFGFSFHMPLFLLISGHFFRPERIRSKCLFYILTGVLLKLVIYGFTVFTGSNTSFFLLSDSGIPWYLFVLAIHIVITYLLRDQNRLFVLIASIVVACAAGFDPNIGDQLYLSRAIVFFPFFWAGTMFSDRQLLQLRSKGWPVLCAAVVLAVWIALCVLIPDQIYILRHLMTGRNAYLSQIRHIGPLLRLLTYLITAAVSLCLLLLMPNRKLPGITKMGSRTIDVYFWHWPVFILLTKYAHVRELFGMGMWGRYVYLIVAVALTVVLSLGGPISWPLEQLRKLCSPPKKN